MKDLSKIRSDRAHVCLKFLKLVAFSLETLDHCFKWSKLNEYLTSFLIYEKAYFTSASVAFMRCKFNFKWCMDFIMMN